MKRREMFLAALGMCMAASSAHAHHSYGTFYDLCTSVTIAGRIDTVQWKTPHILIDLRTDEGTAYRAEWTGPLNLASTRITADTLKAGDRVVVTGSPLRDDALRRTAAPALDPAIKIFSALSQIRRPSDSWNWTGGPSTTRPECARQ